MASSISNGILSADVVGTGPSPLGNFSKLPPEIRAEVWRFLLPIFFGQTCPRRHQTPFRYQKDQDNLFGPHHTSQDGLGILRASQQLYYEVSAMRCCAGELCFHIVSHRYRAVLDRRMIPLTIKGLPGAGVEYLASLDLSRFKSVRFEIDGPTSEDDCYTGILQIHLITETISGQLCYHGGHKQQCYRSGGKCRVSRQATEFDIAELNIVFKEWELFRKVYDYQGRRFPFSAANRSTACEVENFLIAFRDLRQVTRLEVQLPDLKETERALEFVGKLGTVTQKSYQDPEEYVTAAMVSLNYQGY